MGGSADQLAATFETIRQDLLCFEGKQLFARYAGPTAMLGPMGEHMRAVLRPALDVLLTLTMDSGKRQSPVLLLYAPRVNPQSVFRCVRRPCISALDMSFDVGLAVALAVGAKADHPPAFFFPFFLVADFGSHVRFPNKAGWRSLLLVCAPMSGWPGFGEHSTSPAQATLSCSRSWPWCSRRFPREGAFANGPRSWAIEAGSNQRHQAMVLTVGMLG